MSAGNFDWVKQSRQSWVTEGAEVPDNAHELVAAGAAQRSAYACELALTELRRLQCQIDCMRKEIRNPKPKHHIADAILKTLTAFSS